VSRVDFLLVEDNRDDADLILRAMAKHLNTADVAVARDGAEALSSLADTVPTKAVLLDLKLPKVSGFEVLKAIRADARTHALPVVILTSSGHDADMATAYALGANSYVVKPMDFDEFLETVSATGQYWAQINQVPS
jgi:two-component system response regulator